MTNPDPGRETRVYDLLGRSIVVRQLLDSQIGLLQREQSILVNPNVELERKVRSTQLVMKVLLSMVVQPDDADYVDELIADGEIELSDLFQMMALFREEKAPAKPRVQRGRSSVRR